MNMPLIGEVLYLSKFMVLLRISSFNAGEILFSQS
jgi:hypothetical protein